MLWDMYISGGGEYTRILYFEPSDSIQVGGFGRVGPARIEEDEWLRERQKDISPDERND